MRGPIQKPVIAVAATLTIAATPALPLSCLRPDVVRMYEQARDAETRYWMVLGQLVSDTPLATPQAEPDGRYKDNASASSPARFEGLGLHADGFHPIPDTDVTVTITCIAHWCGSVPLGEELFMAIEVTDAGPMLLAPACSSRVVRFSEEDEVRLLRCALDGLCAPGE